MKQIKAELTWLTPGQEGLPEQVPGRTYSVYRNCYWPVSPSGKVPAWRWPDGHIAPFCNPSESVISKLAAEYAVDPDLADCQVHRVPLVLVDHRCES